MEFDMRYVMGAGVLAGLLLAGCATQTSTPREPERLTPTATVDQKVAAYVKYNSCLKARARAVDDHISDAMTVARAIKGSCFPELGEFARVSTGGQSARAYYDYADWKERNQLNDTLRAVLAERRGG
jgi:outer membrane murein-binding lipoprotein Lpp